MCLFSFVRGGGGGGSCLLIVRACFAAVCIISPTL